MLTTLVAAGVLVTEIAALVIGSSCIGDSGSLEEMSDNRLLKHSLCLLVENLVHKQCDIKLCHPITTVEHKVEISCHLLQDMSGLKELAHVLQEQILNCLFFLFVFLCLLREGRAALVITTGCDCTEAH